MRFHIVFIQLRLVNLRLLIFIFGLIILTGHPAQTEPVFKGDDRASTRTAIADSTDKYRADVERVIASGAARDKQWLRLGHYKRRGFVRRQFRSEFLSEADGEALFLSKSGKHDPIDELRSTLLAFGRELATAGVEKNTDQTASEERHAQCLFPARRKWAFQKLGWEKILRENELPVLPCEARRAWKNRLDAEGVSIVFASAYLNNPASMFGHTFLKFHSRQNRGGKDLLDYGVNFAADTGSDGGLPFAAYGLFGVYAGRFTMQPFHETLKTYANLEGRDLIEYRIHFSSEELDFFIDHLFELERTYFDYYFLSENCSYFLLTAIEAAKPDINLSDEFWYEVIPADSVRVVARTPGLVESTKFRPSLLALFRAQADRLSGDDIRFAKDAFDEKSSLRTEHASLDEKKLGSTSTAALDLALDYGAVRAATDPAFDELNHQLRAERAKRGGASPVTVIEPPPRPEEGHDPARVGVVFELPTDRENARGRLGLQTRFAYHDRLSNDDGYLKGTTLEVLRITALNDDRDPQRVRVREVAVFDVLSAQPSDAFSQPISWRASFGIREPCYAQSIGPYVNGGAGGTFSLTKYFWLSALLDGEGILNPDFENNAAIYLGPRLIGTAFIARDFKIGFDYAWMRPVTPARHYDRFLSEAAWAPTRNLEFRIGYSDAQLEGARRSEWSFKVFQHLLF